MLVKRYQEPVKECKKIFNQKSLKTVICWHFDGHSSIDGMNKMTNLPELDQYVVLFVQP